MTVVAHFVDSLDPGGAETLIVNICQRLGSHRLEGRVLHLALFTRMIMGPAEVVNDCETAGRCI
jgi:hypothetical protein